MRVICWPKDPAERLIQRMQEAVDHECLVTNGEVRCIVLTEDEYTTYKGWLIKMGGGPGYGRYYPPSFRRWGQLRFQGYPVIRENELLP